MQFEIKQDAFHRLPRHPDWTYELWDGAVAHLAHRPQHIWLSRSTASRPVVANASPHEVRVLRTTGEAADALEFLVTTWRDEDPYRTFDNPEPRARTDLAQALSTADLALAAFKGSVIHGAVLVSRDLPTDLPGLSSLIVAGRVRNRAIATSLLGSCLAHLYAHGVPTITSAVSGANVASLRWHLSRGFTLQQDSDDLGI